jgi:hypothetical protein
MTDRVRYRLAILSVAVLLSPACAMAAAAPPADSVPITIADHAGVSRDGELVTFGIPLPRDWQVIDPAALQLSDEAGESAPAQFQVLARWGASPAKKSAPVKWLLVNCRQSIDANGRRTLTLRKGPSAATLPQRLTIDTTRAGRLTVDTGAATFVINTDSRFNLLEQVTLGGQLLLQPLPPRDAIAYRAIDGLSVVPGGQPDFTPRKTAAVVERSGPLSVIVRVAGSILDERQRAILDYTARWHFAAGSSDVRLDFTVENNHPVIPRADDNQPTNVHNQGAVNSVHVGDMQLKLRLRDAGAPLIVRTEQDTGITQPSSPLRLYQDSSGTDTWNNYVDEVGWPGNEAAAAPRLQSYCELPGYEISGGGLRAPRTGRQALGWMTASRASDNGPSLTVAVRDFWQNFPKALEASPDGTIAVNLFPNGSQFRHNLRVGEEKTHTVLLHFARGPIDAAESERMARAFNQPLFGVAPADWYARSGTLGDVPAADLARWPLYERYVRIAFEPNPDFDPGRDDPNYGNRTLRQVQEHYNFFGWQDYGDVPLDYEAFGERQAGQMNLKYWYVYGMFLQFCRSGEPRWLEIARPAAWHLADVDFLHTPDEGPQHWCHGAYFGHSQHDEPGNLNPNRNGNSPSVDLFFGVPDLLLAYHLTGESRFRDVALEGLPAMQAMSEFSNFADPILLRERANLIFAYIEACRETGDERWRSELRKIVRATCDLKNKGWVSDPERFFRGRPDDFLSMFQFCQVVWTLGRYLDFCQEYELKDDLGVGAALTAYADFLVKFAMRDYTPGRAAMPSQVRGNRDHPDVYLEINNWSLLAADVLAYAAKYSGDRHYLDAAEKFYQTGVIDPVWQDDPPVFLATKDLVNACHWGLVYMNQQGR